MESEEGVEAGAVALLASLGPVHLAALLRAVRKKRMQTRQDVAKRIGTSAAALRRAESGDAPVPLGTLAALASYYGEDLTAFVETPLPILVDHDRSVAGNEVGVPAGSSDLAVETLLADLALARLGTVLQSTREAQSGRRREVASRVGTTTRELRRYETGSKPVPRGILTALAEFYGEDLDTHFAHRNPVPADPSIAGVEEAQVHSGDGDEALGAYVGMLRRVPEQALDEPITLHADDVAVLSTALAVAPEHVNGRIAELLARTTRLRHYQRTRRRKRILSGAGLAVVAATIAGFGTGALVAALPSRADPLPPTVANPSTTVAEPLTTLAEPLPTVAEPSTSVAETSTTVGQPTAVTEPATVLEPAAAPVTETPPTTSVEIGTPITAILPPTTTTIPRPRSTTTTTTPISVPGTEPVTVVTNP